MKSSVAQTLQLETVENGSLLITKARNFFDWTKNDSICRLNKMDTIGAIAVDINGNLGLGTSSGGAPFKIDGRIGSSAIPGAGFWALNLGQTTTKTRRLPVSALVEKISLILIFRVPYARVSFKGKTMKIFHILSASYIKVF